MASLVFCGINEPHIKSNPIPIAIVTNAAGRAATPATDNAAPATTVTAVPNKVCA